MSDGNLSAWEALQMNDQMSKSKWAPLTEAENKALGAAVREFADKHGISLEEEN